jgi:chromate transport protein ChrA
MRLPPFFWPLTLLFLSSADIGMTTGHPPVGILTVALPAVVALVAAVAFVLGRSRVAAAVAVAVFAALAGYALGYALPPYGLLIVLVALALVSAALSTIWLKSKGAAQ